MKMFVKNIEQGSLDLSVLGKSSISATQELSSPSRREFMDLDLVLETYSFSNIQISTW